MIDPYKTECNVNIDSFPIIQLSNIYENLYINNCISVE